MIKKRLSVLLMCIALFFAVAGCFGFGTISINEAQNPYSSIKTENILTVENSTSDNQYVVCDGAAYLLNQETFCVESWEENQSIGFDKNNKLELIFLKDSLSRLSSFAVNSEKIASILTAEKVGDQVCIDIVDERNKVSISTSLDAEYTLGESALNSNNRLSFENGNFKSENARSQTSFMAAQVNTTAKILYIKGGKFTLGGTKEYTGVSGYRGIYVSEGELTIESGIAFSTFTTETNGSAVYQKAGTVNSYATYTNCTGISGSAIYSDSGTLNILGGSFEENSSTSSGGAVYAKGTLNVDSAEFTNNHSDANGGAVYFGSTTLDCTLTDTTFALNDAVHGGAFYTYGTTHGTDVNFHKNTATKNGGAGVVYSSAYVEFTGGTVELNTAGENGGAFSATGANGSMLFEDVNFHSNSASSHGGALNSNGTLTVTGGVHIDNTAVKNGGFLYTGNATVALGGFTASNCTAVKGGFVYASGSNNNIEVEVCEIKECSATIGGAIYTFYNLYISESNIHDNEATSGSGGAIYLDTAGDLYLGESTIEDNTAYSNGGAVFSTGINCNIVLNGTHVIGNSAQNGGAIYSGCGASITGGTISGNSASVSGGVLHMGNVTSSILDCEIYENTAGDKGGVVYASGQSSSLSIGEGCEVHDNSANVEGGVVYSYNAVEIYDSDFQKNSAGSGGAIFTPIGTTSVTISNTDFTEHTAGSLGGAVHCYGTLSVNACSMSDNTASAGGAIYAGTATLDAVDFYRNKANGAGGAIYGLNSITLADNVLDNNSAANLGGTIYCSGSVTATVLFLTNSSLTATGDTARSGGAIYAEGDVSVIDGEISNVTTPTNGAIYSEGNVSLTRIQATENTAAYGGLIYTDQTSSAVTLTDCTVSKHSAYTGGVIYTAGKVEISGGSYNENFVLDDVSTNRGAVVFITGSELTVSNTTMNKNTAEAGAAICVATISNTATITNCTMNENSVLNFGGAIYTAANMTLDDVILQTNSADTGGALYVARNTTSGESVVTLASVLMSGNTATWGGAAATIGRATLVMAGGEVKNNTATNTGGAFYGSGKIQITAGTISGNSAKFGGAIDSSGEVEMTNGTISGNTASNYGGAIQTAGKVTLSGGNITSNTVTSTEGTKTLGGAVYGSGRTSEITLSGANISGNSAENGTVVYTFGTVVNVSGGTISANNDGSNVFFLVGEVTFTMTGGSIINHSGFGAVVYSAGGATIDFQGGSISNNSLQGINVNGSTGIVKISGGEISGNTCSADGAGINVSGGFDLEITGGQICGNTSTQGKGGGIYATGDISLANCLVEGNTAYLDGGGIYVFGDITMTLMSVNNNTSQTGSGGAIYLYGVIDFVLDQGTISGNTAYVDGGGVYSAYSGCTMTMTVAEISDNTAVNGGGIYSSGTLTINSGTISGNTATNYGGAVYFCGPTFTFTEGDFIDNSATVSGGGIAVIGATSTFGMSGGRVYYNTSDKGGGVYCSGIMNFSGGYVSDNEASTAGGGIFLFNEAYLTISGTASLNDNLCGSEGGGIYAETDTIIVDIVGGNISYNHSSGNGGAVFIQQSTLNVSGGNIVLNSAGNRGGAFYVTNKGTINISSGTFEDNSAVTAGVVYYNTGSTINVTGGSFVSNTASGSGGVFSGGGSIYIGELYDLEFSGNTASNGDDIYLSTANYLRITDELSTDISVYKYGRKTFENEDIPATYIAYSEDDDCLLSAYHHLKLENMPSGAGLDCGNLKPNYLVIVTKYTITFSVNNGSYGSVGASSISVPTGSVVTTSGNTLSVADYVITATPAADTADCEYDFVSWSISSGTVIESATSITATFSATVVKQSYTVTFVASPTSYGSVSTTEITVEEGTSFTTSGTTLTIAGQTITATPKTDTTQYSYSFGSWSSTSGTITADTTITARFQRVTRQYVVRYKSNGGFIEVNTSSSAMTNGAEMPLTLDYGTDLITAFDAVATITLAGNTFVGWSLSSSGAGLVSTVNGTMTVYAVWGTSVYTVYNDSSDLIVKVGSVNILSGQSLDAVEGEDWSVYLPRSYSSNSGMYTYHTLYLNGIKQGSSESGSKTITGTITCETTFTSVKTQSKYVISEMDIELEEDQREATFTVWLDDKFKKLQEQNEGEVDFEGVSFS